MHPLACIRIRITTRGGMRDHTSIRNKKNSTHFQTDYEIEFLIPIINIMFEKALWMPRNFFWGLNSGFKGISRDI
jgi:hypothetical protein